ncbi:serine hydrolase [Pelagibacterium limicola]|uniref:serine hydrolase n=1 Tax=Pelagibacterium limicola TaxID=2791022 RepID=UPI0018AF7E0F|nr:serine hydrolase [Pelagibacterium limicola]
MRIAVLAVLAAGLLLAVPALAQSPVPSDEEIEAILERRVEDERQGVGLVVGIVEPEGARVISYGTLSVENPVPVDGDTLFEIGSVTKVFTTLLLADAVERGEVTLDQPVADFLPEGVTMPERDGQQITLFDLATYSSGLPRLPDNIDPADPADPYADYTADNLHGFLSSYELARGIGEAYEYSNVGAGLLGHVLALNAGTDYETLLRERILEPLGMNDTVVVVPEAMEERFAVGHDAQLQPVAAWQWDVLEGAGALRSTANDLNKLLAAMMGHTETGLARAFALATEPQAEIGDGVSSIGLGWHMTPLGDDAMVWHNGGTSGARAFIGYLREGGIGVVALSNVATPHGVDDLAPHLLNPEVPLIVPPQQVEVDPAVFEGLTGDYELAPGVVLTIFTENERLFAQLTEQEAFEIYPASETAYFYRVVDAQITFDVDDEGNASGLTLYQFGSEMPAPRAD